MRFLWWWISFTKKTFKPRPEPRANASVLDEIVHDDWYKPKQREKPKCCTK